jgi:hypothetical protein
VVRRTELLVNNNFAVNCGKMLRKFFFQILKMSFFLGGGGRQRKEFTSTEPVYKIQTGTTSVEFDEGSECLSMHKRGKKKKRGSGEGTCLSKREQSLITEFA